MSGKITVLLLLLSLALAAPAVAVQEGDFSFGINAGSLMLDSAEHLDDGPVIGVRLGYELHRNLGLEGSFSFADTRSNVSPSKPQAYVYTYRADLLYYLLPESSFVPFLTVGSGIMSLNGSETWGNRNSLLLEYGLGFKYFLSDNLALRGDARNLLTFDNNRHSHLEFTGGITYYFSKEKTVPVKAVAEERQAVVPPKPPVAPAAVKAETAAVKKGEEAAPVAEGLPKAPPSLPKVAAPAPITAKPVMAAPQAKTEAVKPAPTPLPAVGAAAKTPSLPATAPVAVAACQALKEVTKIITIQHGFEIVANSPLPIPKALTLVNPTRLALDIDCATNGSGSKVLNVKHSGVVRVRISSYPNKLRIVFDFDQDAVPSYRVEKTSHGLKVLF